MVAMFDEIAGRMADRADFLAILSMWDVTDAAGFKSGDDAQVCYEKLVEAVNG